MLMTTSAAVAGLTSCGGDDSGKAAQSTFTRGKNGVGTVPVARREPAPDLSGTSTTGKKLDVRDYRGKVVVVNIWGSWCGPCNAEAPHFAEVARDTAGQGVRFVGINTRDSTTAQAVSFEEQHRVPYPSLFDPTGKLLLRFPKGSINPQLIPTTVAIDRHGRTAARAIGPLNEKGLREMIRPLLAEK